MSYSNNAVQWNAVDNVLFEYAYKTLTVLRMHTLYAYFTRWVMKFTDVKPTSMRGNIGGPPPYRKFMSNNVTK